MKLKMALLVAMTVSTLGGVQAAAQDKKFAGYVIKAKTDQVEGVILVDGYSPAEVIAFVGEDCASGQVGDMKYVGKPQKKRGRSFQKFVITCPGGPSPRIGQTSLVSVEVERMPDGRNMTEYTFGVDGSMQYTRYIR